MAQSDDVPGQEPVDPVFAALFRDEPALLVSPAPDPAADPAADPDPDPIPGVASDRVAEPDPPQDAPPPAQAAPSEQAAPKEPAADTGRLFRSQGVRDNDIAVLALASDHGGRLRTLTRVDGEAPEPAVAATGLDEIASSGGEDADHVVPPADAPTSRARTARDDARRARGLRAGAVYLLVIGVTVLVAFANALLAKGDIGWPTGIALVAVTAYCAWNVRRDDDIVAIISPPIAFFVAALTAGQLFLGSAEGSLINRVVVAFFTLADNWYWIIGATVAALVIVIVRRRRA